MCNEQSFMCFAFFEVLVVLVAQRDDFLHDRDDDAAFLQNVESFADVCDPHVVLRRCYLRLHLVEDDVPIDAAFREGDAVVDVAFAVRERLEEENILEGT